MVNALEIIEIGAVALCNRSFDLVDADVTLNHMLKSLKDEHSDISVKLYHAMEKRILQRRDMNVFGLARYLNPEAGTDYESMKKASILPYPTKTSLAELAKKHYVRLNPDDKDNGIVENTNDEPAPKRSRKDDNIDATNANGEPAQKKSKKDELYALLAKRNEAPTKESVTLITLIKREMAVFEGSGGKQIGEKLAFLKNALATVPPTSVEVERLFSAAGLFVTKLRTSLSDEMLDTLCFLRASLLSDKK